MDTRPLPGPSPRRGSGDSRLLAQSTAAIYQAIGTWWDRPNRLSKNKNSPARGAIIRLPKFQYLPANVDNSEHSQLSLNSQVSKKGSCKYAAVVTCRCAFFSIPLRRPNLL